MCWQSELHFRTVKSTVQRDRSKAKSADIVGKECYAGLLADNLVRGLMAAAATQADCLRMDLSFSRVHGLLAMVPERLSDCLSLKNENLLATWAGSPLHAVRLPTDAFGFATTARRGLRSLPHAGLAGVVIQVEQ